jgi:glycine cleavage system H protein
MIRDDLKYSKEHEWVKIDGDIATVGITDYAQGELGDVVFVELPEVGDSVEKDKPFGTIEAVKAVAELFSPLSGTIEERNEEVVEDAGIINSEPYGKGWMLKIKVTDPAEVDTLLTPQDYAELSGDSL